MNERIYIADDEKNIRELIAAFLTQEGYAISDFPDGDALMAACTNKKPDLVILDVMMPGVDGLSVCSALRRDDPQLPILIVSAKDSPFDRVTGLTLGSDDYSFWGGNGKTSVFSESGLFKNITFGFLFGAAVFAGAYSVEFLALKTQGHAVRFGFFTTGFSLTGAAEIHCGVGFILLCVFFNIINVIMEEGTFRGLFYTLLKRDHNMKAAILMQALLFGVWHVVTPLHNLIDGDIGGGAFIVLSVGYILLAGIMGIKWALMAEMTGSLYAGMADHFFDNCIATNLLHVSTESSTDELMIIRVLIAQLLSFFIVLKMWKLFSKKKEGPIC